jgi:aryl-alcohol dehydrogenase-like predicted oxidoreductase
MHFRALPETDLKVSALCIGTMNFGQQTDERTAHEILDAAISSGINFIDTAEVYPIPPEKQKQGISEEILGRWLQKNGNRSQLVVASKVSARGRESVMRTRDVSHGLSKKSIHEALDGTLLRLGTDYLDLYQVHMPDRHVNNFGIRGVEQLDGNDGVSLHETLEGLNECVLSGKVRAIGISNETPWGMMKYLDLAERKGLVKVSTIQNQYSLLNRTFEIGLSEMCLRENVGLLAYSALNMGVLSGKYLKGERPPGARFTLTDRSFSRYNPPHAQVAVEKYVGIARTVGIEPVQLALAFALSRSFMTSVIIAATSVKQLEIDVSSLDVRLSEYALSEIQKVYETLPDPTC